MQAMLDYLAVKVAQELVGNEALTTKLLDYVTKSSIVQTESTDPTTVPSSPYFKQVTGKLISDFADVANKVDATLLPKTDYVTNTAVFGSNWINLYQMSNLKLFIAFGTVKAVIPHHTIITLATVNGKYGGAGGGLCAETNDNFVKCHSWLVVSGSDILVQGYFDTDVPVGANMYFGGFWIN